MCVVKFYYFLLIEKALDYVHVNKTNYYLKNIIKK